MAKASNGAGAYFTHDELEVIGTSLTMGDVWRVRAIDDDEERGAALYYHAALRLGLHAGDMESFLDRILEADFAPVLLAAAARGRGAGADEGVADLA